MPRVASDENSRHIRFERKRRVFGVLVMREFVSRQHKSPFVQLDVIFQESCVRSMTDEDKRRGRMNLFDFIAVFAMLFDRLQFRVFAFKGIHDHVVLHVHA